jgi:hypothetical protein
MRKFPGKRILVVSLAPLLLGGACLCSEAQILPSAPLSPTDITDCQSFSKRVEAYAANYTEQHQQCLADNKPDEKDETPDSLRCSRSACQYLHDYVFADTPLSAKYLRREVLDCYKRVDAYKAEQSDDSEKGDVPRGGNEPKPSSKKTEQGGNQKGSVQHFV